MYGIIGITGHVGRAAAETLLAKGAKVRAIVRSEAKGKAWRDRGAEIALASLNDPAALADAFAGLDGLFIMTPPWVAAADMFAENAKALESLKQALQNSAPPKIALLSSIGAERPHGTGAIMKLHDLETALGDFPSVTSVRAAWFMENFAGMIAHVRETGILPSMLRPLDREIPMVATADIGRTVADVLLGDWSGQRVIELEGPRRYSPNDVAAAFGAVLARPVQAQVLPDSEWRPLYLSLGFAPRSVDAMVEMLTGFNTGWISFKGGSTETMHGETPLEAVLAGLNGQSSSPS